MSAQPVSVQIDPRGPRFSATLTTAVLAGALLTAPSPLATGLLAAQALVFAVGAVAGVQHTPYAWLFKTLVRPRLAPPTETEDATPPRFAQGVGLAFAVLALVGYLSGATLLGAVATGFALAAAFLNAAFGFCLGCEFFLLVRRARPARFSQISTANTSSTADTNSTSTETTDTESTAGRARVATKG